MSMNFYAASVALLWTTAMRFGAPDAGRPRTVRSADRPANLDEFNSLDFASRKLRTSTANDRSRTQSVR